MRYYNFTQIVYPAGIHFKFNYAYYSVQMLDRLTALWILITRQFSLVYSPGNNKKNVNYGRCMYKVLVNDIRKVLLYYSRLI